MIAEISLIGRHERQMDDKGRVSIPPSFRKNIQNLTFLKDCHSPVLIGFDYKRFDAETLNLMAAFFSATNVDGDGRVLLKQADLQNLEIPLDNKKTQIVFLARGTHFHMMSKATWKKLEPQYNQAHERALESTGLSAPRLKSAQ